MSDRLTGWNPATDPIHKLIQLLDVLGIGLSRLRAGSHRLPARTSVEYTPQIWMAARDRLTDDYRALMFAVFPGADIGFHLTAQTLGDAAVAALVKAGRDADEPAVREAQTLLGNLGGVLFRINIMPSDEGGAAGEGLVQVDALLEQHHAVRESLFGVLARRGYAVPDDIRRRRTDAIRPVGSEAEERVIHDRLLNWIAQTKIADGRAQTAVLLPVEEVACAAVVSSEQPVTLDPRPVDPYARRRRVRELATEIERLAEEYFAASEPLRAALNTILRADPADWIERLYEVQPHVRGLKLTASRYGEIDLAGTPTADSLARHTLITLGEAVVRNDRTTFDSLTAELLADAPVAEAARAAFRPFVAVVLTCSYKTTRTAFLERASAAFARAGVTFWWAVGDDFEKAGTRLSTRAADAICHWLDPFDAHSHFAPDGFLASPGWRPSRDEAPEASISESEMCENRSEPPLASNPEPAEPDSADFIFAPSGNGYFIKGFGESGHLSALKGLQDLARLIRTPGVSVPMVELDDPKGQRPREARSRQPTYERDALTHLNAEVQRLRSEVEEAETDAERQDSQQRLDAVLAQVASATNLRGTGRDLNNPIDKLRSKIHDRLETVYQKMRSAESPMNLLANHFESSISAEGAAYIYNPQRTVTWRTGKK